MVQFKRQYLGIEHIFIKKPARRAKRNGGFPRLSAASDSKNGHVLKLENVLPTFLNYNAMPAKITKTVIIMVSASSLLQRKILK